MGSRHPSITSLCDATGHLISKLRISDNKARLVTGGHTTKAPSIITYAIVVFFERVRIDLIITLNDLEVKSGDILNVYLEAPVTVKM